MNEPGALEEASGEETSPRRRLILAELRKRTVWFVRLRWWMPPCIAGASLAARFAGVEFQLWPVLATALAILAYNSLLHLAGRRIQEDASESADLARRFTYWQVGLDYAAMFLLLHFTGGAASPLMFFFLFHIIFASMLLPPRAAYGFAAVAAAGVALLALGIASGGIPLAPPRFQGEAIDISGKPFQLTAVLLSFTASVFLTAFLTTTIARVLRRRIIGMAEALAEVSALNEKLRALYAMVEAVGAKQHLEPVVSIAKRELARAMGVQGIAVKLLDEAGAELRIAAVHGLPERLLGARVALAESAFDRQIVEGAPYVTSDPAELGARDLRADFDRAGIRSALLVPLGTDRGVIGVLGAYCRHPDRFDDDDIEFFRLAAGLLAIAIANARAHEAVERMVRDRSRFMWRVGHNLRAPLAAALSILEVVRGGYLGELTPQQAEYIRRVDRRGRTMAAMINELLVLAKSRTEKREPVRRPLDLGQLAGSLRRTFKDEAAKKGLAFEVHTHDDLPVVMADPDAIEQLLENLVSNAIKYTLHGHVRVQFAAGEDGGVRIEVSDTGIGVPRADQDRLFTEFFRADNAREIEEVGTGLGLAIVKETVERHGGRIALDSAEGRGTRVVVSLPAGTEVAS